jgi:hypothetical protein
MLEAKDSHGPLGHPLDISELPTSLSPSLSLTRCQGPVLPVLDITLCPMGPPHGSRTFSGEDVGSEGLSWTPWTSLGHPLDIPWTSLGHPLDIPWTSLGHLRTPYIPLPIPLPHHMSRTGLTSLGHNSLTHETPPQGSRTFFRGGCWKRRTLMDPLDTPWTSQNSLHPSPPSLSLTRCQGPVLPVLDITL